MREDALSSSRLPPMTANGSLSRIIVTLEGMRESTRTVDSRRQRADHVDSSRRQLFYEILHSIVYRVYSTRDY